MSERERLERIARAIINTVLHCAKHSVATNAVPVIVEALKAERPPRSECGGTPPNPLNKQD